MRIKLVTSFDERFFKSHDDFWKTFALCPGMLWLLEVVKCLELAAIAPTGACKEIVESGRLDKAHYTKLYFTAGTQQNECLRKALEGTTVIVFKITALQYAKKTNCANMTVEFRRDRQVISKIGIVFEEDGTESVCAGQFDLQQPVEWQEGEPADEHTS